MLTVDEALEQLLAGVGVQVSVEACALEDALGRVLAESVVSPVNLPLWDHSQMDGYALRASDLKPGVVYPISQRIPAGSAPEPLAPNTVARIFTGAPMPLGADTIVMQEEAEVSQAGVSFCQAVKPGQFVRFAGSDIAQGDCVLKAGQKLGAREIGLLAAMGLAELRVFVPLKIALLTTGDECRPAGAPVTLGQIYDVNGPMLKAQLQAWGYAQVSLLHVPDSYGATLAAFAQAAGEADVIITTGGVSVGEEDHVKPAVEALGRLDVWKVRMKPGKPLAYGQIKGVPFFGLPGNPVAAFATLNLFVRPCLAKLQGGASSPLCPLALPSPQAFKANFRREFLRARWEGEQVRIYKTDDSGAIGSLPWANGFLEIPEDREIVAGEPLAFYPFEQLD
jgi:molybdopterin molybdotransferase